MSLLIANGVVILEPAAKDGGILIWAVALAFSCIHALFWRCTGIKGGFAHVWCIGVDFEYNAMNTLQPSCTILLLGRAAVQ